jgi:5-methyltetrahydrofolate--homocysteine methyltransferase
MTKGILRLIEERVVLLDGGTGTTLINLGLPPGTPPEAWNLVEEGKVKELHKAYFAAGSDVVLTNTFGGTRVKLSLHGLGNMVEEINKRAVELVKSVCPQGRFVAGDIGPSGKALPPVGNADINELKDSFTEQAHILADAGVDFLIVETMFDLDEASAAVEGAVETGLPVFASVTFRKTKRGFFTVMGNDIPTSVSTLTDAGAAVIGTNCTLTIDDVVDLVGEMNKLTNLPLLAKPNAGNPEVKGDKVVYPFTPKAFASFVPKLIENGARVVGGCCGTTPEHIRLIAEIIKTS